MRRFILGLALLSIAVWLGVNIAADPGYVLIAYHHWTAETPVWFALLLLILIFTFSYFTVRLLKNISLLPRKLRNWTARRRARINQRLTHHGLLALSFGKWAAAEKKLIKATSSNALAWLNYLAAARAAYERGDKEKREFYLSRALQANAEAEIAIGIEQFQFQYEQQRFEQALAILQRLHQLAPQQNYILRRLIKLCARLEYWPNVLTLLPAARQRCVLPADKLMTFEVQAQVALLHNLAKSAPAAAALKKHWETLPRALRQEPELLYSYANTLAATHESDAAELLIRTQLNQEWHEELVYLYGLLHEAKPELQLTYAEKWLATHMNNAVLELSLGRICLRHKLWGKARSYFEASLAHQVRTETYYELAALYEKLGETALASATYKTGLSIVTPLSSKNTGALKRLDQAVR